MTFQVRLLCCVTYPVSNTGESGTPDTSNQGADEGRYSDEPDTNKDELVRDVKAGDSLGCSEHERQEFRIPKGKNKAKNRSTLLYSQESRPLGELLRCVQCHLVLERRGVQEVSFSRITSPSSRTVHSSMQEVNQRWQEAGMNK